MAKNIIAQVLGGNKQVIDDVSTISEVKSKLNVSGHAAVVNGEPVSDSYDLEDGDYVHLSPAVKGGLI